MEGNEGGEGLDYGDEMGPEDDHEHDEGVI
jgi:hypothetical protein